MTTASRLLRTFAALTVVALAAPAFAGAAGASSAQHRAAPAPAATPAPHVFAGTPLASSAQAPWSVLVERQLAAGGFATYCSGSLITPNVVITAAHCLFDEGVNGAPQTPVPRATLRIQAGVVAPDQPGGIIVGVTAAATHPYYKSIASGADVALLVLATPVPVGPTIAPIAVAKSGSAPKQGKQLSQFGWGLTETQAPAGLRSLTTTIAPSAFCAPGVAGTICGGSATQAACPGDSGGSIVRVTKAGTPELVGIESYGEKFPEGQPACQLTKRPDGYADLTQPTLNRFIAATLAGKPSKPPKGPRAARRPKVQRVSRYSRQLRCSSAGFGKKAKVRTYWAYEKNRKVLQSGRSSVYSVRRKDRNKFIFCGQIATNKGGRAAIESSNARKFF